MRISFFKNRIGSDSKKSLSDHLWCPQSSDTRYKPRSLLCFGINVKLLKDGKLSEKPCVGGKSDIWQDFIQATHAPAMILAYIDYMSLFWDTFHSKLTSSFLIYHIWKLYLFLEHQYQPVSSFLLTAAILVYPYLQLKHCLCTLHK